MALWRTGWLLVLVVVVVVLPGEKYFFFVASMVLQLWGSNSLMDILVKAMLV